MKIQMIIAIAMFSALVANSQTLTQLKNEWGASQSRVQQAYGACTSSCPRDKLGRAQEWDCKGGGGGPQLPGEICNCKCELERNRQLKVLEDKYLPLINDAEEKQAGQQKEALEEVSSDGTGNVSMKEVYEKAAKVFLDAAIKTKCTDRQMFFIKSAGFNTCMAEALAGKGNGNCGESPNLALIPPCAADAAVPNVLPAGNVSPVTADDTPVDKDSSTFVVALMKTFINEDSMKNQMVGGPTGVMTYGQVQELGGALDKLGNNIANKRTAKIEGERDYQMEKRFGFTVSQYSAAVERGDTLTVSQMVKQGLSLLTPVTGYEDSINGFHIAAFKGNMIMCRYFLKHGINVDVFSKSWWPQAEWTPLFFAIDGDRRDVVKFLLANGANPYHKVAHGAGYKKLTALQLAKRYKRVYIEKLLTDWEKEHPERGKR